VTLFLSFVSFHYIIKTVTWIVLFKVKTKVLYINNCFYSDYSKKWKIDYNINKGLTRYLLTFSYVLLSCQTVDKQAISPYTNGKKSLNRSVHSNDDISCTNQLTCNTAYVHTLKLFTLIKYINYFIQINHLQTAYCPVYFKLLGIRAVFPLYSI